MEVWEVVSDYSVSRNQGTKTERTHSVVALEVDIVDWVVSDDGSEKPVCQLRQRAKEVDSPDIGFGQLTADKEFPSITQDTFQLVQSLCQGGKGSLVRFLSSGESSLVNPIIDIIVDPFIDFVNLFPQVLGVKIQILLLAIGQNRVESSVQIPDNFTRLVTDDSIVLSVPQSGDSKSSIVARFGLSVDLVQVVESEEMVFGSTGECLARMG